MFFFQKPTYDSLQQSLETMTNRANKHKVNQISMPKAGCGLDRLEWHKVERVIKGNLCTVKLNYQSLSSKQR